MIPPPFATVPKIHPFWYRHPSLSFEGKHCCSLDGITILAVCFDIFFIYQIDLTNGHSYTFRRQRTAFQTSPSGHMLHWRLGSPYDTTRHHFICFLFFWRSGGLYLVYLLFGFFVELNNNILNPTPFLGSLETYLGSRLMGIRYVEQTFFWWPFCINCVFSPTWIKYSFS